jgi:hypothetical protein
LYICTGQALSCPSNLHLPVRRCHQGMPRKASTLPIWPWLYGPNLHRSKQSWPIYKPVWLPARWTAVVPPPAGAGNDTRKCGHCRCTALRRSFKAGAGKRHCSFSKKSFLDAKELGKAASEKICKTRNLLPVLSWSKGFRNFLLKRVPA